MELLSELRVLIARHCRNGRVETPIPGMILHRTETVAPTAPVIYEPRLCVVAQGRKRVILGEQLFEYDAAKYLVASVELPVVAAVVDASRTAPYLAFSMRLDPAALAAMALDMPENSEARRPAAGLAVSPLTDELLDAAVRLLRLLDRPRDISMLAPLAEREILYRLMLGEQSAMLRQIARADSRLSQIARAIGWIRENYEKPLRIEALAEMAGMSLSSFHRHFKAVTAMSPLQFQKRMRLQEARRRVLAQGAAAARIGFSVGYESPSQFCREYSRLFGVPPGRDAARLRGSAAAPQELAQPL
jgi:AraC-like DNA-binding protein